MGQIFRLTSFLNNLLNFLRVIFENMIGTTDKYNMIVQIGGCWRAGGRGGLWRLPLIRPRLAASPTQTPNTAVSCGYIMLSYNKSDALELK